MAGAKDSLYRTEPDTGELSVSQEEAASPDSEADAAEYVPGTILTSTLWNQSGTINISVNGQQTPLTGYTYNQYCPFTLSNGVSTATRSLTGCTNTADASIVYYWLAKGYRFDFEVADADYFDLRNGSAAITVSMTEAEKYGAASAETLNAVLAGGEYNSGDFIAALNFYCGIKNHSKYGTTTSTTYWHKNDFEGTRNGKVYKELGFDSSYSLDESTSDFFTTTRMNGKTYTHLTEEGYALVRECIDYGEVIRVSIPGHSIYLDGYRYNTGSGEYEYHLNYGWGVYSSGSRWYTGDEMIQQDIGFIILDITPHVTVTVKSDSGCYEAGSMLRGLERLNHVRNDTATTVTFAGELAGKTVELDESWSVTSQVDVDFTNFNIDFSSVAQEAIASTQAMTFSDLTGNIVVNYNGSCYAVKGSESEELTVTVNGGGVFSGFYSDGINSVFRLLNSYSASGYSVLSSILPAARGVAFFAGTEDDTVVLKNKSAVLGDMELGGGNNCIRIENGSVWYGDLDSAADIELVLTSAAAESAFVTIRDDVRQWADNASLQVTVGDDAAGKYLLVDASGPGGSSYLHDVSVTVVKEKQKYSLKPSEQCSLGKLSIEGGKLYFEIVRSVSLLKNGKVTQMENYISGAVLSADGNDTMKIDAFGLSSDTQILDGGTQIVSSGDSAAGTLVKSGGMMILSGGSASGTVLNKGGSMTVRRSGEAEFTTVKYGGRMVVSSGGTAEKTILNSGGRMFVSRGGTACETLRNKGKISVLSGGVVSGGRTSDGGVVTVSSGGSAVDIQISSGGKMTVKKGGRVSGLSVTDSDCEVTFAAGAVFTFQIASLTLDDRLWINDWASILGKEEIAYEVRSSEMNAGVYKLAYNAEDFSSAVTVCSADGVTVYGSLKAGETLTAGDKTFSLTFDPVNRSLLTLLVADKNDPAPLPENLSGDAGKISWDPVSGAGSVLEIARRNKKGSIALKVAKNGVELYGTASGSYVWHVRAAERTEWADGKKFTAGSSGENQKYTASANGISDIFWAGASEQWSGYYEAKHTGNKSWSGTGEKVALKGKNKISDLFYASADANILYLTDDKNGDALFVDDIYTELPSKLKAQSRLSQIDEVRAGRGSDVIDFTSRRYSYSGGGVIFRGGAGDDTIWANKGKNHLFGDAGNDRLVGASGDDFFIGGSGDDSIHGGGGDDIFCFAGEWGDDTIEQLAGTGNSVTLWFAEGISKSDLKISSSGKNTEISTLYGDITVKNIAENKINFRFGSDRFESQYAQLKELGAFSEISSEKIFEEEDKKIVLASL